VHVDWGTAPTIWLEMEFSHRGATIYFSLALESRLAGVEINYLTLKDASACSTANTVRVIEAIADARNA